MIYAFFSFLNLALKLSDEVVHSDVSFVMWAKLPILKLLSVKLLLLTSPANSALPASKGQYVVPSYVLLSDIYASMF